MLPLRQIIIREARLQGSMIAAGTPTGAVVVVVAAVAAALSSQASALHCMGEKIKK